MSDANRRGSSALVSSIVVRGRSRPASRPRQCFVVVEMTGPPVRDFLLHGTFRSIRVAESWALVAQDARAISPHWSVEPVGSPGAAFDALLDREEGR